MRTCQRRVAYGLLLCLFYAVGCADDMSDPTITTRSALTTSTSRLVVPAYFADNSSSWTTLETGSNALPAGSIVIANYDSGPGWTSALHSHLATLKSHGVIILGYVNVRLDLINNAENDMWAWSWTMGGLDTADYGSAVMDGIFFDDSARRNDDDINRLEYLGALAHSNYTWTSSPGYVMYNYGTPFAEHNYTDCLLQVAQTAGNSSRALFVTRETYENTYRTTDTWSDSAWSWVNSYKPEHFAHLLHDASTSSTITSDTLAKARARNAMYVYVTDLTQATNPWEELASSSLWHNQVIGTNGSFSDFGGVSSETYSATCPSPCSGGACWCNHPVCESGWQLDPACSPCVATICAPGNDPYCCNTEWDGICVGEVQTMCNSTYSCS